MSLFLGAGVLTVIWCLLMIGVARIAQGRGRSVIVWSLLAGAGGGLGVFAGLMLANRVVDDADVTSTMGLVLAGFAPLICMVLPMFAIAWVVQREPIHVSARGTWPVAFMDKGPGTIAIEPGKVRIEWANAVREVTMDQLLKVEADGECVRLTLGSDELVAMPMGKPATPAGRRHQSLILAKRLRSRSS